MGVVVRPPYVFGVNGALGDQGGTSNVLDEIKVVTKGECEKEVKSCKEDGRKKMISVGIIVGVIAGAAGYYIGENGTK